MYAYTTPHAQIPLQINTRHARRYIHMHREDIARTCADVHKPERLLCIHTQASKKLSSIHIERLGFIDVLLHHVRPSLCGAMNDDGWSIRVLHERGDRGRVGQITLDQLILSRAAGVGEADDLQLSRVLLPPVLSRERVREVVIHSPTQHTRRPCDQHRGGR